MSLLCPAREEWTRKLDGEVTANRAAVMTSHASTCTPCREIVTSLERLIGDIAHPVATNDSADVSRVMRAIDSGARITPIGRPLRWLYPVAGALAAAAVLIVFVATRSTTSDAGTGSGTFQARGGGGETDSLDRNVGITIRADGTELAAGATVLAEARYTAGYRNLFDNRPVHVLVFAVDAARTTHWLYPAFTDPDSNPPGILLARSAVETPFDDGAILDRPEPGTMAIFTLISTTPVYVSLIESLDPNTVDLVSLREQFADMRIEQLLVTVAQ